MALSTDQVRELQTNLNKRLHARGRPGVDVDGEYGSKTAAAVHLVKYLLGFPLDSLATGPTEWFRSIVAHPSERPAGYLQRARDRVAYLEDRDANAPLRVKAYRAGMNLLGVVEEGGNNRGPEVSKIILANGGVIGEPWCGDYVAWCYRTAGSKAVQRLWASVYYLGRLAGLYTIKNPELGDIVRYNFSHTGLFVKWLGGGYFEALEGNTGARGAVSDSKTGGDGVYLKRRHVSLVENFRRVSR